MAKIGDEVAKRYGVEVVYKSTVEHRGVLVLRGPVSHKVSDTDPHKVGMRWAVDDFYIAINLLYIFQYVI